MCNQVSVYVLDGIQSPGLASSEIGLTVCVRTVALQATQELICASTSY